MRHNEIIYKILFWVFLFVCSAGVIFDGMIMLGLPRGWQYVYNLLWFIYILPVIIFRVMTIDDEPNDNE